jgi:hypothetical protein
VLRLAHFATAVRLSVVPKIAVTLHFTHRARYTSLNTALQQSVIISAIASETSSTIELMRDVPLIHYSSPCFPAGEHLSYDV